MTWHAAATLAAPLLRLHLGRRARRGREIPDRLAERRGLDPTPRPEGRLVWLHAASVGETVSVLPVVAALAARAADITVLLTTGTVTSAQLLAQRLPEMALERRVLHRFVPLDVPRWAARFLDHWRPDAACFVESELWPNLIAAARVRGVPMLLLNARLSAGSAASWRRAPGLARAVLGAFDRIAARSEADAARLVALGAANVSVPGDLKFAAPPLPVEAAELARLAALLGARPVWLAASTHPGEDAIVIAAHRRIAAQLPDLVSILVPRHPARGVAIARLAGGLPVTRRGAGADPPQGGLYIADTLGELGLFYRLAPIAFIGGSLVAHGGQNLLEAARLGCAVAAGPHIGNFAAAAEALAQAGALTRVDGTVSLAHFVAAMLRDSARQASLGDAARRVADRFQDLPERSAEMILALTRRRPA